MKKLLASIIVSFNLSAQTDNNGCIGLKTAKDIFEANLISQGEFIDTKGIFDSGIVERLDYDDTVGFSVREISSRSCITVYSISCTGKYSNQQFCN